MARVRFIFAATAIGVAGCAAGPTTRPVDLASRHDAVEAVPADASSRAALSLDEIFPRISLPPGRGIDTGSPPIEAIRLYAQSHAALLDQDRAAAIDLMKKAIELDPAGYLVHLELGKLYLTPAIQFSDRSIAMLEKAAELEPDHLDLQTNLGRQYLAKGDSARAMAHFRLALLTAQYSSDQAGAAIVEFFLATLLRNQGYDQAALETYQRLSAHLRSPRLSIRANVDLEPLVEHADAIDSEIADLLVRRGKTAEAIEAYATLVRANPSDLDLRSRQVRAMIVAHMADAAMVAAEQAIIAFHANAESIALLGEATAGSGQADGVAASLTRLHAANPGDRSLLYALADVLRSDNRAEEAEKILAVAAEHFPSDVEILRRRFMLKLDRGGRADAAMLLLDANARDPDLDAEIGPLWSFLARASAGGRLRYTDLATIPQPPKNDGAKWFWVWRLASAAHREDVAYDALAKSLAAEPAFAPAYRDSIDNLWNRLDLDAEAKRSASEQLAAQAEKASGVVLANEIRGLALFRDDKFTEAVLFLGHAADLGGHSPDLLMARAVALRKVQNDAGADAILWKLLSDRPMLRDAYLDIYLASIRRGFEKQAERVVTVWLAADPTGAAPRRIQALQYQRAGRKDAAESILVRLFADHGDDPQAVEALAAFYTRENQSGKLIKMLQERIANDPGNLPVATALCDVLASDHRQDDAVRFVDAARKAVAGDPDLLYTVSGLYSRIDQKAATDDVLEQVLKLDPAHPGAANDLGYSWAEDGRNLPRAEELIRKALAAEPSNISYLDSMGWLLYKRGRFSEAKEYMNRAVGDSKPGTQRPSDPVVLDHRGDVLYQLGEKDAAASDWQRAADRIEKLAEESDAEMKTLRQTLLEKMRKVKAGQPAPVATFKN